MCLVLPQRRVRFCSTVAAFALLANFSLQLRLGPSNAAISWNVLHRKQCVFNQPETIPMSFHIFSFCCWASRVHTCWQYLLTTPPTEALRAFKWSLHIRFLTLYFLDPSIEIRSKSQPSTCWALMCQGPSLFKMTQAREHQLSICRIIHNHTSGCSRANS